MKSLLDRVDGVLAAHSEPTGALAALCAMTPLDSLLSVMRDDASSLAVLARRSYRHRNGFDKIVIAEPAGSPLKLVLHVWPQGGPRTADDIHNHRWNFSSVVVSGTLHLELYEPDISGPDYAVMEYRSLPGAGNFELRPKGTTTASARKSETLHAGSTYTWACQRLHRAWGALGHVTATLVVQGAPSQASTTVLVRGGNAARLSGVQCLAPLPADAIGTTLDIVASSRAHNAWDSEEESPTRRSA